MYIDRSGNIIRIDNSKEHFEQNLVGSVYNLVKKPSPHGKHELQVVVIDVNERDGLTTIAENLRKRLDKDLSKSAIVSNDSKDVYALPNIASLIGVDNFMKLAVKNKLAKGYLRIFGIKEWIIIVS